MIFWLHDSASLEFQHGVKYGSSAWRDILRLNLFNSIFLFFSMGQANPLFGYSMLDSRVLFFLGVLVFFPPLQRIIMVLVLYLLMFFCKCLYFFPTYSLLARAM